MIGLGALIGTTIAGGLLGAAGSMGSTAIQGAYNREEAQKNRDFQERMSNTAIQRSFADARKAGISPAMLLGEASQPMGNSASIGQSNAGGEMSNTVNKIVEAMKEDRKLDAMENMQNQILQNKQNMQNERLEHQTQMLQMKQDGVDAHKFAHSARAPKTREEWNSYFQNIDDIKI